MKIKPVISEKSLEGAKSGFYTFKVNNSLNKYKIKELIEKTFKVKVDSVKTMNTKSREKVTIMGRKKKIQAEKKVVVTLKGKDKIEIFETKE